MGRLGPNFMALVGLALAWASIFKAQAGPKYALVPAHEHPHQLVVTATCLYV